MAPFNWSTEWLVVRVCRYTKHSIFVWTHFFLYHFLYIYLFNWLKGIKSLTKIHLWHISSHCLKGEFGWGERKNYSWRNVHRHQRHTFWLFLLFFFCFFIWIESIDFFFFLFSFFVWLFCAIFLYAVLFAFSVFFAFICQKALWTSAKKTNSMFTLFLKMLCEWVRIGAHANQKNKQFFSRFILDSVRIIHQNRRTSNAFNIFFNNNISNAFRIILFPYLSLTKWSLEIVEVSIHRSLIENWISWNSSMSIIWKIQTIKRKKSLKWLTILPNLLSKLRNKKDGKRASAFYWTEIRFNARFVKRYQHWQCIFFFFTLCCYCLFLIANVRAVATAISVKALKIYHLTHAHFQFGISGKQKEKREQKTHNRQW